MKNQIPADAVNHWNKTLSIHWPSVLWLASSPFLAVGLALAYVHHAGFFWGDFWLAFVLYFVSGLGITAGYHRYFSHRTHKASRPLEILYMILGTMVMQRSILMWSRNHRIHHRYADTELDPHNIREGFLHAHMGWIFRNRPIDEDFTAVPDLLKDRLVMFQHKYYWWIFAVFGVGFPALLGWILFDRPLGGIIFGGLVRVVLQNHAIFSINSVAHTFGKQNFSLSQEARDSWLLALISNGEGFHSFHHRFASDYRNGWRWYHWDPSKWFIQAAKHLGLASDLKVTPEASVLKALVSTQMELARKTIQQLPAGQQAALGQKLTDSLTRLETMLQRWQETKAWIRRHRESRRKQAVEFSRQEYAAMKARMREYHREFLLAREEWIRTLATLRLEARALQ